MLLLSTSHCSPNYSGSGGEEQLRCHCWLPHWIVPGKQAAGSNDGEGLGGAFGGNGSDDTYLLRQEDPMEGVLPKVPPKSGAHTVLCTCSNECVEVGQLAPNHFPLHLLICALSECLHMGRMALATDDMPNFVFSPL